MSQFSEDMEKRKASIGKKLKEGNWTILDDLHERVTKFNGNFLADLRTIFDF